MLPTPTGLSSQGRATTLHTSPSLRFTEANYTLTGNASQTLLNKMHTTNRAFDTAGCMFHGRQTRTSAVASLSRLRGGCIRAKGFLQGSAAAGPFALEHPPVG